MVISVVGVLIQCMLLLLLCVGCSVWSSFSALPSLTIISQRKIELLVLLKPWHEISNNVLF